MIFWFILHQGQITESDSLIPLKVIDQNEAKELKTSRIALGESGVETYEEGALSR